MSSANRLRPWLLVVAAVLVLVVAAGLYLRRDRAPETVQTPEDEPDPTLPAAATKRTPPRFDEATALRGRVAELSDELEQLRAEKERQRKQKERDCLGAATRDCPFLEPSPEALAEMARCAIVKMDMPNLDDLEPRTDDEPVTAESLAITEAKKEVATRVREELQGLHRALGLGGVPDSKVTKLMEVIEEGLPRGGPDVQRQVARERAGLGAAPPIDQQGPGERFFRLRAGIGDEYERALAGRLGAGRARALRRADNGWSFRGVYAGECQGDGGF